MTTESARRRAFMLRSQDLAEELGQIRREGDSWFLPSISDRTEDEHRVDLLAGRLFCTCQGYVRRKTCKHVERIAAMESTELAIVEHSTALARQNPAALAVRLQDMKDNRRLTRQFFADVMEEGTDYGVIPGTEKPTLFKPGAESLCELYGYAPTYPDIHETKDMASGFLRVVVTCRLVQRGTGEVIAEGLGECNTREARYFYRWMPDWEMRKYPQLWEVRDTFKKEERKWRDKKTGQQKSADFYRTENDDLFTLWNTVLKMAKKRAHVDATLSATRSSGIFSQGQAALEDWIEADYEDITDRQEPALPPREPSTKDQHDQIKKLWDNKHPGVAEIRTRFPHSATSAGGFRMENLNHEEAAEAIALLSAKPACEHEADDGSTGVLRCVKCQVALEGPDMEGEQPSLV